MRNQVLEELKELKEEKYKDFSAKLIPGINKDLMLGVRLPILRQLGKTIAKGRPDEYLESVKLAFKNGEDLYFEEKQLWGMVIGYIPKLSPKERIPLIEDFLPAIDNWSVCDSAVTTYKFMKNKDQKGEWFSYILEKLNSKEDYTIRFGLVSSLNYFSTEEFFDETLEHLIRIGRNTEKPYYVMMANAWALAELYAHQQEKVENALQEADMDPVTLKKTRQKIRESRKI